MNEQDNQIVTFGAERHYHSATIERWLGLAAADKGALLGLATELRLGENQLRDLWEWAEEVVARDHSSLAAILNGAAVVAPLHQRLGRQDRLKLVKAALRRLRFPQLSATEDRLRELLRQLPLPTTVRVELPDFLEGDELRIEFRVASPTALRQAAAALLAAADSAACAELFHLLDEAP